MRDHLRSVAFVLVLGLLIGSAAGGRAQQKDPSGDRAAPTAEEQAARQREFDLQQVERAIERQRLESERQKIVPVRVQVVISRFQGEKKISSLPYTLSVNANGGGSSLRMGANVPVFSMAPNPGVDKQQVPTIPIISGPVQYQPTGTNIDCRAVTQGDGRFVVMLTIEDTSVYGDDQAPNSPSRVIGPQAFRTFQISNEAILGDGQSTQFSTATDRITGEVVRVDVTLTVAK